MRTILDFLGPTSFFLAPLICLPILVAHAAPSFNCKLAKTKIEKSICAHESIGELDFRLSQLYQSLFQSKDEKSRPDLRSDQKNWVSKRNSNCASAAESCLREEYETRIVQLQLQSSTEKVVREGTRKELEDCIKVFWNSKTPYKGDLSIKPAQILPGQPNECGYGSKTKDGELSSEGISLYVGDINNDGQAEYIVVSRCGGSAQTDSILEVFQKRSGEFVSLYFDKILERNDLDASKLPLNLGSPILVRSGAKNRIFFRSPIQFWTWEGEKLAAMDLRAKNEQTAVASEKSITPFNHGEGDFLFFLDHGDACSESSFILPPGKKLSAQEKEWISKLLIFAQYNCCDSDRIRPITKASFEYKIYSKSPLVNIRRENGHFIADSTTQSEEGAETLAPLPNGAKLLSQKSFNIADWGIIDNLISRTPVKQFLGEGLITQIKNTVAARKDLVSAATASPQAPLEIMGSADPRIKRATETSVALQNALIDRFKILKIDSYGNCP